MFCLFGELLHSEKRRALKIEPLWPEGSLSNNKVDQQPPGQVQGYAISLGGTSFQNLGGPSVPLRVIVFSNNTTQCFVEDVFVCLVHSLLLKTRAQPPKLEI